MTDEYRAYLESKKTGEPEQQDIPHWKPPQRKEETPESSDSLAHYGVRGMKWGVINAGRDAEINKTRGKVEEAGHKILSALGNKKARQADAEKEASDKGIKEADRKSEWFTSRMEGYTDPEVKTQIVEEHLWEMRGLMNHNVIGEYKNGDVEATKKIYEGAKMFDNLMNDYASKSGTTLEDDKVIQAMSAGSQELDDLYNELKKNGVTYPESDPEYAKKYKEVHENLDGYADHVAGVLGFPNEDKEAYGRIKDDLKVLWFKTGYTNLNGYDNTDWTQYGEAKDRRELERKAKEFIQRQQEKKPNHQSSEKTSVFKTLKQKLGIQHSDAEIMELPFLAHCGIRDESGDYLAHYGINGQKWHVRRFQNKDGSLTPAGILRYRKNGTGEGKKEESSEEAKPKKERYNSKTLTYKMKAQHLTDEELDRRNRRMQREVQYNQLRSQLQPKTKAERRKELRRTIFVATATTAAAAIMTQVYKKAAVFIIKQASGGKIDLSGKSKKG